MKHIINIIRTCNHWQVMRFSAVKDRNPYTGRSRCFKSSRPLWHKLCSFFCEWTTGPAPVRSGRSSRTTPWITWRTIFSESCEICKHPKNGREVLKHPLHACSLPHPHPRRLHRPIEQQGDRRAGLCFLVCLFGIGEVKQLLTIFERHSDIEKVWVHYEASAARGCW